MPRKFALILALLMPAMSAAIGASQIAHADAKPVKLRIHNSAKLSIHVLVNDRVSKKEDDQRNSVTPGGDALSTATPDAKGNVDFVISVVFEDRQKGSFYRCLEVKTNVEGKNELKYDVTESSGRSC